jgi:phosphoglycolate phosphatase
VSPRRLLILFDIDGTLFLTPDRLYGEALVAAVREVFGHELTAAALARSDHPGETALNGLRKVLEDDGLDSGTVERGLRPALERLTARYLELLAAADTEHWELAPHAVETLEQLARDNELALLTGNPEAMARARMERLGLARFFPAAQGGFGSDGEDRADLIELARKRAGRWPAGRTVLVGDTPKDVEGAHRAGVHAVGVTTGAFDSQRLAGAEVVVDDLAELPHALEGLAA